MWILLLADDKYKLRILLLYPVSKSDDNHILQAFPYNVTNHPQLTIDDTNMKYSGKRKTHYDSPLQNSLFMSVTFSSQ